MFKFHFQCDFGIFHLIKSKIYSKRVLTNYFSAQYFFSFVVFPFRGIHDDDYDDDDDANGGWCDDNDESIVFRTRNLCNI